MSPLWPQYYEDCRMVVFVVDVADASSIAPAALELCELMQHPKVQVSGTQTLRLQSSRAACLHLAGDTQWLSSNC